MPHSPVHPTLPANIAQIDQLLANHDAAGALALVNAAVPQTPAEEATLATLRCVAAQAQGQPGQAADQAHALLARWPDFFPGWIALARAQAASGQTEAALSAYARAHAILPSTLDGLREWAALLMASQRFAEALEVLTYATGLEPNDPGLQFELALSLQHLGRHDQAIPIYQRLLPQADSFPLLVNNLAAALNNVGRLDEAMALYEQQFLIQPDHPYLLTNASTTLHKLHRLEEAAELAARAVAVAPDFAMGHNNLGLVLRERQQWAQSEAAFERALALDPALHSARWNLAMARLLAGDFASGWPLHESRWLGSHLRDTPPNVPMPLWEGQPLAGKTLFLWGEQGFGDALQFARYVPLVQARARAEGGRMHYCTFPPLLELFENSFKGLLDEPIMSSDHRPVPPCDYHLPLLSAPLVLGLGANALPQSVPYLKPTAARVKYWRQRLAKHGKGLKVGLVWSGSRNHTRNPYRAIPVEKLAPLALAAPGARFFSLQFDGADEVTRAAALGLNITDWTASMAGYNDSAAFVSQLDLVIGVCTSTAHLAGALGVPAWVALDLVPHWVWQLGSELSDWYPRTRLYRQSHFMQWDDVVQRMANELATLQA